MTAASYKNDIGEGRHRKEPWTYNSYGSERASVIINACAFFVCGGLCTAVAE